MTYQSGLSKTLDDLKKSPETIHSFGDIIRKAVLETDGVSVEKFKDKIDKLYRDYFNHWDRSQSFPEKNKGIENRYKKDLGFVLETFYKKESLKKDLIKALSYEESLDKINKILKDCESAIADKDRYLEENKKVVNDSKKRQLKYSELKSKEAEISQFFKDNEEWIISENEIKKINEQLPVAEAKLEELEIERSKAKIKADNESLIRKFTQVEKCKNELDCAEKAIKHVKKLDDNELKSIRYAFNEVERLKTSVEAGRLRAIFETKKALVLKIQKDFDEEYSKELSSGGSFFFEAGGGLKLEHPEWKLDISSGEEAVGEVLKNYEEAINQRDNLLSQYGIQSLEEAEKLNKRYNEALNAIKNATYNFTKELDETHYEDFFEKMEKINKESGSEEIIRPLDKIVEDATKLKGDINHIKNQLDTYRVRINELILKNESKENILIKLGKASFLKEETIKEIEKLSPLPEGIQDVEAFIEEYESVGKERETLNNRKFELLQERLSLEKEAPEESAEELQKQQKDAEDEFQIVLRKAEAVARIRDLTQDLLATDSGTYDSLKKDLEQYISLMTNGRHRSVKMEDGKSLPCGFVRNDGEVLGYELLSAGTKDVFSLALRLSMAKYFLKEASGFLIMDDPFVDMDPERQQKAGESIRKFAEEKQVIIFTCHPTHAEILGGNQIKL